MREADLSDDLLTLARRIDDGQSIDWDDEERRAASDPSTRAMLHGFRVLAGVAAVARAEHPADGSAPPGAPAPTRVSRDTRSTERWGPITLEAIVGRGAFSTVYRATDPLGRHVAVKLLDPRRDQEDREARVLREGRLLASVKHPNIVVVHGADTHDGRVGLWMEFLEGRTLAAEVETRGPHGADEAIVIGRALCGALAAVHAKGLVHGDVKAHNVMREAGGRVVLMDFGAGQAMQPVPGGVELLAGTPLYLCPERLAGGPATAATDVYSLGVLLYYLVSECYPVEGDSRDDVDAAHRAGRRTPLRDRRPDLPEAFVAAIEKALAPDPADRYPTVGAFDAALGAAAGTAPVRHRSVPVVAGLAAVAVIALASAVALWQNAGRGVLPAGPASAAGTPAGPASSTGAGVQKLAISAGFLQLTGDVNGSSRPRHPLVAGARVQKDTEVVLELEPSRDVHVYVVNEDERGNMFRLYPAGSGRNPLSGGRAHVLPHRDRGWLVDPGGGREHLFVVVSPTPLADVEAALAKLPGVSEEGVAEGEVALNTTRGMSRQRAVPPADMERPWRKDARPLLAGREEVDGVWVRELVLQNPAPR